MSHPSVFSDVLEATEHLDPESQRELVAVLIRRLVEHGRERVTATVNEARREFVADQCQVTNADNLICEAQS